MLFQPCDYIIWSIWAHCSQPQILSLLSKSGQQESRLLNFRRLRSSRFPALGYKFGCTSVAGVAADLLLRKLSRDPVAICLAVCLPDKPWGRPSDRQCYDIATGCLSGLSRTYFLWHEPLHSRNLMKLKWKPGTLWAATTTSKRWCTPTTTTTQKALHQSTFT